MNQLAVISTIEASSVVQNNNRNKYWNPNNICPILTSSKIALQTASL
jgi:hypothetical protein